MLVSKNRIEEIRGIVKRRKNLTNITKGVTIDVDYMRISISQLQDNPSKYLHQCHHELVEVTNRGNTLGYLVPPQAVNVQKSYSVNAAFGLTSSLKSAEAGSLDTAQKEEHDHTK